MVAEAMWLPLDDRAEDRSPPLAGWLSPPLGSALGLGVLLLPSVGYEYCSSHRAVRSIAEALARRGCPALRIDYPGAGDSAGHAEEIVDLAPWRDAVQAGVAALRDLGVAGSRSSASR